MEAYLLCCQAERNNLLRIVVHQPLAKPLLLIMSSRDDLLDFKLISRSIDKYFPNVRMIDIKCVKGRRFFMRDQIFTTEVAEVLISLLRCKDWKLANPNIPVVSVESIARKLSEPLSRRAVLFKGII
jgi:hypothetical protein